ncbi:WecB/TagA/CpsF family glycosyltransferase [Cognaticolwellia mytili]|uniref:WecB/TagA/CpsF family glycosyltransferase n=1 Tax=Cognaticolwellia mytili TaxID=1888913 RepID=UPI001301B529|nr:WecB/TagA/CpsF family glycosyltransferase [Cognaticolwellia mytili]
MPPISTQLFGFNITSFSSLQQLTDYCLENPAIYVSLNAEALYHESKELTDVVNKNIGYCDGIGAVFAVNLLNRQKIRKTPGCELWLSVLNKLKSEKIALIGAEYSTLEIVKKNIGADYPNVDIAYSHDGFFQNKEKVLNEIVQAHPKFVFVALGQPKQEQLCMELQRHLPDATFFPIGGSFDVYAGKVNRAPKWLIKLHLEWLYRLIKDPKRWRRQLVLPMFLFKTITHKLKIN